MKKRIQQLIENQAKVKVIAHAREKDNSVWLLVLTAAVAFSFYFFSLFFGGIGWRALNQH